jgi:hypothetical protein
MGRKGGGFGTTLVQAFVIIVLSVALVVRISRFGFMERIPIVGPFLFEEQPAQTTTGPVVVEGIQDLNQLATVCWTEYRPDYEGERRHRAGAVFLRGEGSAHSYRRG